MRALQKKRHIFTPKRTVIAICIVVLGAALAMLAIGASKWPTMVSANQQLQKDSERLREQVIKADTRDARVTSVRALAALQPSDCSGQWWYDWQASQSMLPASEQKKACEAARKKITDDIDTAKPLARYLEGEQEITEILATLAIDGKNKNWQEAAGVSAAAAQRSLNDIVPEGSLETVHAVAVEQVEAIVLAWTKLESASKKEDRASYQKAHAELQDAYAALAEITDESDAQIKQLLKPFTSLKRTQ